MERFLFPFLPIFLLAMVRECRRPVSLAMKNLRPPASWANPFAGGRSLHNPDRLYRFLGMQLFVPGSPAASGSGKRASQISGGKKEVYSWIRDHTPVDAKIVVYEDVLLFLYSRRQAFRPIALLPAAAYSKRSGSDSPDLAGDLAHLSDAPRAASATYWLVTGDDFALDASRKNRVAAKRDRCRAAAGVPKLRGICATLRQ
jgi:hypothetical protein